MNCPGEQRSFRHLDIHSIRHLSTDSSAFRARAGLRPQHDDKKPAAPGPTDPAGGAWPNEKFLRKPKRQPVHQTEQVYPLFRRNSLLGITGFPANHSQLYAFTYLS